MWCLVNCDGVRLYLNPYERVTFGRKKTDILLLNDKSISKIHASIYIEPKEVFQESEPISVCTIKDEGSKYGTYVLLENEKIQVSRKGYALQNGDVIRLGVQNNIFTVVYLPIITAVSTLSDDEKSSLQEIMDDIDGIISTSWSSECTHLTVSKAALTEKVTWAMASAVPIVTMKYWREVKRVVHEGEPLPKPNDFVPPLSESLVNKGNVSLCPNEKRKTLFRNLIFVHFCIRQYQTYGKMITLAGGKSILYAKKPLTEEELRAPNVIVLQHPAFESQFTPEYDSIYKMLQKHRRKMIPESEIPLAILYCSVDKYCNPNFKFSEFLKRSEVKHKPSEILVLDTQDVTADVIILPKVISNVQAKSNSNKQDPEPQIVPETYDNFSSQDLISSNIMDSHQLVPKSSTPLRRTCNRMSAEETKENVNEIEQVVNATPKDNNAFCVPETYDSFVSNILSNEPVCSNSAEQQDKNITNMNVLKQSIVANEGTSFKRILSTKENVTLTLKKTQSNTNKCNKNRNEVFIQETSDKVSKVSDKISDRSPEIQLICISEKHVSDSSISNDKMSKTASQTNKSRNSSQEKFRYSSGECDTDEEFVTPIRKKICSESTDVGDTMQSKLHKNTIENQNTDNFSTDSLSFLRASINYKKFKKAPVIIPEERITLADMYVWSESAEYSSIEDF